ncbi:hypothetical protein OFN47_30725, partial [Escherichia coli]|nr:hypothetical protein [Escherichia coli]
FGFVSLPERGGDKAALAYGDDDRFHESRLVWSYQFNLDLLQLLRQKSANVFETISVRKTS